MGPIEAKSNNYASRSSLDKFRKKFPSGIDESYLLYVKDVMQKDGIVHLPFYMTMLL